MIVVLFHLIGMNETILTEELYVDLLRLGTLVVEVHLITEVIEVHHRVREIPEVNPGMIFRLIGIVELQRTIVAVLSQVAIMGLVEELQLVNIDDRVLHAIADVEETNKI